MAVQEQTPYQEITANGVTTSFVLDFDCENKDHLIVTLDGLEPPVGDWSLIGGSVVFITAPANDVLVTIQRNTPLSRTTDYQSYNNSFRPWSVNGDFDRIWLKLQELGVVDWLLSKRIDKEILDRIQADIQYDLLAQGREQELKVYLESIVNNLTGENTLPLRDLYIQTWSGRTQEQKNKENISAQDYGAVGNGTTNDSAAFTNLELEYTGRTIDLLGKTYLVNSVPTGNNYINGSFLKTDGKTVQANNTDALISALADTGYDSAVPNDQITWLGTYCAFTGGVTNRHTRANIASQICRADFARSMNGASIYSYAGGNISANIAARTSQATSPQTVNVGTEECLAQGFAGVNVGAQFSLADGSRCGNVVARYCFAGGGRLASNFGSHQSYAGAGWGLWTDLTFTGGVLTGVTILNGGQGYKTGGTISIQARQVSPTTNATLAYTVNSNGTVDSITIKPMIVMIVDVIMMTSLSVKFLYYIPG